jgi:hypothetical protein
MVRSFYTDNLAFFRYDTNPVNLGWAIFLSVKPPLSALIFGWRSHHDKDKKMGKCAVNSLDRPLPQLFIVPGAVFSKFEPNFCE